MVRMSSRNKCGPFFSASALERCGVPVTDDLISITTTDGYTLYPQAQFEVDDYGRTILGRRERVIKLYGDVLLNAVKAGEVDPYDAMQLILKPAEHAPWRADIIADPNTPQETIDAIATSISRTLSAWKQ
jgi:hypothetical protein